MPPKRQNQKSGRKDGARIGYLTGLLKHMRVNPARKARKPRPNAPRTVAGGNRDIVDHYAVALCHPFETGAIGARVPEPWASPTTTYKIHIPMVVNTDASGSFDAVIAPHVLNTVFSTYPSVSATTGITGGAALAYPVSVDSTFTSAVAQTYLNAGATATSLASKFKNYRVVSYGVRLKTNVDFTHANGRIYWARVAAPSQVPLLLGSGSTISYLAADWECPLDASGHMTSQIVDMPEAGQLQVSQLLGPGGHEWTFHPVAGTANQFIDAVNLTTEQSLSVNTPTGTIGTSMSTTYASTSGFQALWLKGEGCVPASLVPGAFSLEVILHVEGTQNILGGSSAPDLVASAPPPALASPMAAFAAVKQAMALPAAMPVAAKAEAFAKREAGALWGKAKGALASKGGQMALSAGKALGLALI